MMINQKTYAIYGLGAALVDTEISLLDTDLQAMQIEKGVMSLVDEARQHQLMQLLDTHLLASKRASGGSAANTIIAASYFGCHNFFSCKFADDDNGRFYLSDLTAAGVVSPSHIVPGPGITGKCLVMITPDAERSMNTFLGVSAELSVAELDLNVLAASDFAYVEGYLVGSQSAKHAAVTLLQEARRVGTKTVLSLSDPAMVQYFRDGLLEMIGDGVDLIFCNQDEALAFTQTEDVDLACQRLRQYGKTFAITCGAQGAILFDGNALIKVVAPKVTAVDSNGAGDMFAGAFLYALSQSMGFQEAGTFACLAAATVVSQYGPRLRPEQHAELKAVFSHLEFNSEV
ncbi:MAG: adenosine kinase [Undibacterium sp.]|nr:adenosine kinase [Undibacterium sp.]